MIPAGWENAPTLREVMRTTYTMIDIFCASYASPPRAVTLDIDDTVDIVHGHQQLALFNAHCDERCFLPIHVYDTATARPVAVLLRPGNTVLDAWWKPAADDVRVRYAEREAPVVRRYAETRYGAKCWTCERRVAARIDASSNGLDIRYVVTNLEFGSAEWLYGTTVLRARPDREPDQAAYQPTRI
jgi:hypothetical protein